MRSIVAQWPDRPGRDLFVHRRGTCLMGAVDVEGERTGVGILVFVVRRAERVGGMAGGLAPFR